MTASRLLIGTLTIGLMVTLAGGAAPADDPWPDPRPVARDVPAFRAPTEPPDETESDPLLVSEPAAPLTLEAALALALMHNPELAAFSWETRAGEARALQAGTIPNPELDMRLYRLENPGEAVDDDSRMRVVLSQVFELGGKRKRRLALAQSERALAGWDYEAKRIEVATMVAERFLDVLGAQRRVESLGKYVEFFDATRDRVVGLVESGAMRSVEVHQVTRRVGLARIELQEAVAELAAGRFKLAATWAGSSPRFTEVVGEFGPVSDVPEIETVLDLARQAPEVARRDAELERARAALSLAKSGRVPDLNYGVGIRWEDDINERDYLVDLEVSLPIFDTNKGEIREARYAMARSKAERKAVEVANSALIAETYYELIACKTRCDTLSEQVVPSANAMFEAYRVGLERSAGDVGDLLDARRDLARAAVQQIEALVDYHQALARLEGLIGGSLTRNEP